MISEVTGLDLSCVMVSELYKLVLWWASCIAFPNVTEMYKVYTHKVNTDITMLRDHAIPKRYWNVQNIYP